MSGLGLRIGVLGAAAAISLAACSGQDKSVQMGRIYTSVVDCSRDRTRAECEADLAEAKAEHLKVAEAFSKLPDCERQWGAGRCQQAHDPNGGTWYTPQMAAFMVARALTAIGTECKPDDAGCPKSLYVSHPVYVNQQGWVYSNNQKIGTSHQTRAGVVLPRTVTFPKPPVGSIRLK